MSVDNRMIVLVLQAQRTSLAVVEGRVEWMEYIGFPSLVDRWMKLLPVLHILAFLMRSYMMNGYDYAEIEIYADK